MIALKSLGARLFGTANDRKVKAMQKTVAAVNAEEPRIAALSDDELRGRTEAFRARLAAGETLDDLLAEAFATVREAAKRALGLRPFDVQIVGAIVLHEGRIAEMKTGEGKTLVATLPVYLNALSGKGVHIVTVNDYLAKRDAEWMGKVYRFLGLTVGVIVPGIDDEARRAAYACDITYGTNNEYGFDYLRDNGKYRIEDMVQRGHNFAIVDEVDSILIDEARTPLIISGPAEDRSELYTAIDKVIPELSEEHFEVDEKLRAATLTEEGNEFMEERLQAHAILPEGQSLYDPGSVSQVHHVNQALQGAQAVPARPRLHREAGPRRPDRRVHRPDDGRAAPVRGPASGDRGQGGRGDPARERDAGLRHLPELFPSLRQARRHDRNGDDRSRGVPLDLRPRRDRGADQRAGGARRRRRPRLPHGGGEVRRHRRGDPRRADPRATDPRRHDLHREVRDARRAAQAEEDPASGSQCALSRAGGADHRRCRRAGAVTIATNMAGRGTDIQLGGNVELRVQAELAAAGADADPAAIRARIEAEHDDAKKTAIEAGGLWVVGTERHESRRIDNQLRGRSGRQGDPGRSTFYLSLEDDLMRIFGSERIEGMLSRLGLEEGEAIVHPWVNKAIEKAQGKVEARNFDIRKNLLKFDDVMNDQRKAIFGQRMDIMEAEDLSDTVADMRHTVIDEIVTRHMPPKAYADQWETEALETEAQDLLALDLPVRDWAAEEGVDDESVRERLIEASDTAMSEKEAAIGPETMRQIEKSLLLQILDKHWREHLVMLDHLRAVIGFRGYAQKDPLNEYKREAFQLFETLLSNLRRDVTRELCGIRPLTPEEQEERRRAIEDMQAQMQRETEAAAARAAASLSDTPPTGVAGGSGQSAAPALAGAGAAVAEMDPANPDSWGKVGRNAPCPCGSGKKFKHCHGRMG